MSSRSNTLTLYDLVSTEDRTLRTTVFSDGVQIVSEQLPINVTCPSITISNANGQKITDVVGTLIGLTSTCAQESQDRIAAIALLVTQVDFKSVENSLTLLNTKRATEITILQTDLVEETAARKLSDETEIVNRLKLNKGLADTTEVVVKIQQSLVDDLLTTNTARIAGDSDLLCKYNELIKNLEIESVTRAIADNDLGQVLLKQSNDFVTYVAAQATSDELVTTLLAADHTSLSELSTQYKTLGSDPLTQMTVLAMKIESIQSCLEGIVARLDTLTSHSYSR